MRAVMAVGAMVMTAGCAVPSTGVVALSDGLYKVAHQGNGAWVRTDRLKIEATQEAQAYCRKAGTQAKVIDVKEIQARPFGGWPEAELIFKCE